MKSRFGIISLTVVIAVLCLYYLSFTLVSRGIQASADEYARNEQGVLDYFKKQSYLDSVWNVPVYNFLGISKFTYKEIKDREINLGLDLQGGMHVVMEVSPVEIIVALAGDSSDPRFREALTSAVNRQRSSQATFTTLFFEEYERLAPNSNLSELFAINANKGVIDFGTPNEEIKKIVAREVDGAIDRAFNIIRTRIDKFGVSQPNIQRIQGTGRIQIELPGVDNPQRIRKLLQGVAKLEFLEVYNVQEISADLDRINDFWVKRSKAAQAISTPASTSSVASVTDSTATESSASESLFAGTDSAVAEADSASLLNQQASPIYQLIAPGYGGFVYAQADTAKLNRFFSDPEIASLLPSDLKFLWGNKAVAENGPVSYFQLYPVKRGRTIPLTGEVVVDARQSFDQVGRPAVSMNMNVEGAKKWKKVTGQNIGRQIAIVLDEMVYTAPVVQSEIGEGRSEITGNFTIEEAQDLANVLKAGKLPAPTRIVEEVVVGPSLGLEAQRQGFTSVLIGLGIVIVFMVGYYAKSGLVANLALIINIFFIFGVLAQLNAALTLPGIAGIVLTMGMAIDANVLIFERIKEELRKDPNNLLSAIDLGYSRAFMTIFDSNLTTLLTGFFLYSFGTGPIKGFATTLIIGIICSFFTAVYVSRVIVEWMTKKGNQSKFALETSFTPTKFFEGLKIDFISKRKLAYIFSPALMLIGFALIAVQGLNLGVDFKGGRSYVVEFAKDNIVPSDLQVSLVRALDNNPVEVKTFGNSRTMKITTSYLVDDESEEADEKVEASLIGGIERTIGDRYSEAGSATEGTFIIASNSKVGATIADDIADSARSAIFFSLIAIFAYIWLRFKDWRFGLGALAALFHDVIIVIAMFGIARALGVAYEIDQVFVAAMLTIIGYSINDTVVVFDRVREYMADSGHAHLKDTLNHAINSTLNRTLITSLTTLLVVLILFLFGGEVLRGFSFALLMGIFFGTVSSILIATPIFYDTVMAMEKRKKAKSTVA